MNEDINKFGEHVEPLRACGINGVTKKTVSALKIKAMTKHRDIVKLKAISEVLEKEEFAYLCDFLRFEDKMDKKEQSFDDFPIVLARLLKEIDDFKPA